MSHTQLPTFEELLRLADALTIPKSDDEREVKWCDPDEILGLSRQQGGGIELFLCGAQLNAHTPLVQRHLKHDRWERKAGATFYANRLVFPSDNYYIPATAFLAEELLRTNLTGALADSFAQTEPLIEMVLRKTVLSEEAILGLLGELRFLDVLLSSTTSVEKRALILDSWRGHQRSSRDFVCQNRSVEVKATRSIRSTHSINSVGQVDPRRSESGDVLEELFLLSVGFQLQNPSSIEIGGISVVSQVESILERLAAPGGPNERGALQLQFLGKVSMYGGEIGHGYLHDEMKDWPAYRQRWEQLFVRIYDMADPGIQVIRREDIRQRGNVVQDSVSFQVCLPDKVTGDVNPQTDLFNFAMGFLAT